MAGRALTRCVIPPYALELWNLGTQVVKGDLNDEVDAALKGAQGTFVLTNFWDHLSQGTERKKHVRWQPPLSPFLSSSLAALPSLEGGRPSIWAKI